MQLRPVLAALAVTATLVLCACESGLETSRGSTLSPTATGKSSSNLANKQSGGLNLGAPSSSPDSQEYSGVKQIEEDEASRALFSTAEKMLKEGDIVSATILYRRAVNQDPESVPALRGLARLYEVQDRPREALDTWRAITALDDSYAEAHRGMGRNLMTMKLYPKAITELEKAHALGGEDDLKTMNLLAVAYLRSGQEEKAITTLKEATSKSDDLDTRNNLGFAYIMAGHVGAAISVLESVVLDPKATMQQRQNLALAYGLAGREEDARMLSMQDLPPKSVEKNLKTYREMRTQMLGKPSTATKSVKKKKPSVDEADFMAVETGKVPLPKKPAAAKVEPAIAKEPVEAEKKESKEADEKDSEPVPASSPTMPTTKKPDSSSEESGSKPRIVIKPSSPSLAVEPTEKPLDPSFMPPPKPAPSEPVRGMSVPPRQ